jgi:hypothetical protein
VKSLRIAIMQLIARLLQLRALRFKLAAVIAAGRLNLCTHLFDTSSMQLIDSALNLLKRCHIRGAT